MGYGDDIMTTGWARKLGVGPFTPGVGGVPFWSTVFDHNPRMKKSRVPTTRWLNLVPGRRAYILGQSSERFLWNPDHRAPIGELFLTAGEESMAPEGGRYVMIEPNTKARGNPNKAWPKSYWQELVNAFPKTRFIQCISDGSAPLLNVLPVFTHTFRDACGVLAGASAFIGADGGLAHAAAALNVPSVVLWSGFVPAKILTYPSQLAIIAGSHHCGLFGPCEFCQAAMRALIPSTVSKQIRASGPEIFRCD